MSIKNIGKNLTDSFHGAVDAVKAKAENLEAPDFKEIGKKASEEFKAVFQKKASERGNGHEPPKSGISTVSCRDALKVIYYFMAADGEIYHGEEEKFDEIGKELLPDYISEKESIVKECRSAMENVIDPEDHYDVVQDCVENALLSPSASDGISISPKLLVWDLLTVAYGDEGYGDAERRLLRYIVRKLNIDKAIFLEMESSVLTLMDIEKELSWIKTTNRPYLTIEEIVNELTGRKDAVFSSVKDLISL